MTMFPNDDLTLPAEDELAEIHLTLMDELETYLDGPFNLPPAWIWRIIEDCFESEPQIMVFDLLRHLDEESDEESLDELRCRLNEQVRNAAPLQIWGYETIRRVGEMMP
jgi:hypothetical protein